jgi:hypothetical protein
VAGSPATLDGKGAAKRDSRAPRDGLRYRIGDRKVLGTRHDESSRSGMAIHCILRIAQKVTCVLHFVDKRATCIRAA